MKIMIFAAVLLLLTTRVAGAAPFEFKSFSFANFGSPFTYAPTTADDMYSALNHGLFWPSEGKVATIHDLLQDGPTSVSDEYDVGGGLHVAYSASAVYHPVEPLSTASPGIGAKTSASNSQYVGPSTAIGESLVYLIDTVSVNNPTNLDELIKSYEVTLSLDGVVHVSGDAIAQVGEAIRISLDHGTPATTSQIQTLQQGFGGLLDTYHFGQSGYLGNPITLTQPGAYGAELLAQSSQTIIIETFLYVRAQTGGLGQQAGTASADFSNTLQVSNIRFFDENDQVIPGLQVVGSNGDAYPYNAVPEPSTLAFFGVGTMGLLFARNIARRICA